jgi:hypothetical protein
LTSEYVLFAEAAIPFRVLPIFKFRFVVVILLVVVLTDNVFAINDVLDAILSVFDDTLVVYPLILTLDEVVALLNPAVNVEYPAAFPGVPPIILIVLRVLATNTPIILVLPRVFAPVVVFDVVTTSTDTASNSWLVFCNQVLKLSVDILTFAMNLAIFNLLD